MDLTTSQLYLLTGVTLLGLWATSARKLRLKPNRLPLPPGPKRYPVVGNLFEMPKEKWWLLYDRWHQSYGKGSYIYSEIMTETYQGIWSTVKSLASQFSSWGR